MKEEHADTCGALLKHEIAFILGQMGRRALVSVPFLKGAVENVKEAPVVRHECLITLGELVQDRSEM